ncbi:hypothetical protein XAC217_830047 [Xanthomonas citri pv. citri]|nr:hypothetical protein XAC217_830047 [Xanthomonas citri pv. citri]
MPSNQRFSMHFRCLKNPGCISLQFRIFRLSLKEATGELFSTARNRSHSKVSASILLSALTKSDNAASRWLVSAFIFSRRDLLICRPSISDTLGLNDVSISRSLFHC